MNTFTDANQSENTPSFLRRLQRIATLCSARRIEPELPWWRRNTRLRSNQGEASPTLSDNITGEGKTRPENTGISSYSELIVSFFFFNHFFFYIKPRTASPPFGFHCVRMLRRKTEVKAQGFTLKAAMRNSVVSDSIRRRRGLELHGRPGSVVCGQRDAFNVCRKYPPRRPSPAPTWLSLNQTTMWTTEVYVLSICVFIQHKFKNI